MSATHWWVELKTDNNQWYITQFNHPNGKDYNYVELKGPYNDKNDMRQEGKNSAGNKNGTTLSTRFSCKLETNFVNITLKQIASIMWDHKWDTYDLCYNNCQHYATDVYWDLFNKTLGRKKISQFYYCMKCQQKGKFNVDHKGFGAEFQIIDTRPVYQLKLMNMMILVTILAFGV